MARVAAAAPRADPDALSRADGRAQEGRSRRSSPQEHGKTLADAEGSITRGIEVIEFATGIPHLLKGEFSENVGTDVDSWSLRQPVGVCAGITPFNFPAMVPMWMFPIALACGNTFILKPSERDPSLSLRMAELLRRGGPAGRRVQRRARRQGSGRRDPRASRHQRGVVRRLDADREVHLRDGRAHGKRVQALGGAKNHAVVLPDADLAFAAEAIIGAGYGSAGERCMAISAVVAVGEAGDALVAELAARARRVKVGPGDAPDVEMGPVDHLRGARPDRRLHRPRRRRGRDARRRRAQAAGARPRRRILRRARRCSTT